MKPSSLLRTLWFMPIFAGALQAAPPQLVIEAKFVEFRQPLETLFVRDYVLGGQDDGTNSFRGILTPSRYRALMKILEEQRGTDVLSAPRVTTLSGRQAQIKVVDVRYIVTSLDSASNPIDQVLPKVETFEFGPVLDVVPSVRPDGVSIELSMIPSVREFVGYDMTPRLGFDSATPKPLTLAPVRDYLGQRNESPVNPIAALQQITPVPIFRLKQIVTTAIVWDGQTVVQGLSVETRTNEKVPVLGNLPIAGRLFRSEAQTGKSTLLIFVTPTLIDAAGNRLNREADLAFVEQGIPE